MRLAEAISATSPNAAVFMLSSYLEVPVLKRVMGVQCRGAFDKREPEDIAALMRAIAETASREAQDEMERTPRKRGLLGDMAALIREWNRRISAEQSRGAERPDILQAAAVSSSLLAMSTALLVSRIVS